MTEPDAWRFRLKDCPQCQNGGWEVEQVKPTKDIEFGNNSRHSLGYKEERVTEKESLYAPDTIKPIAELLDRAIRDRDWSKAETALSYLSDISDYDGDWESSGGRELPDKFKGLNGREIIEKLREERQEKLRDKAGTTTEGDNQSS